MPPCFDEGYDEAARSHLGAALGWRTLAVRAHVLAVSVEHFARCSPGEALMWPVLVVPNEVRVDLARKETEGHRHEDAPQGFVFHRADEALDDGDAAVLPDGAEARSHGTSSTPGAVVALKLHALVGDDVPRRGAGVAHPCWLQIHPRHAARR